LVVEFAIDGGRKFGERFRDVCLSVLLDGVLEQPFPQGRCGFDVDHERWDGIHSSLTPILLGTTNHRSSPPLVDDTLYWS
jgi:hypothetical protein